MYLHSVPKDPVWLGFLEELRSCKKVNFLENFEIKSKLLSKSMEIEE